MKEEVVFKEYEPKEIKLSEEEFGILKKDFPNKLNVIQMGQGNYLITAQQYVGNLVLPEHVLIIRPKIENLNFFRMLFFSYNLIPDFKPEELEYAKEQEIFELIVAKFLENVELLTKKGFSKGYIEEEDNLYFPKGRLILEENLKRNLGLKNKVYCRYSDFTCDTVENRILKYTLYHLSRVKLSSNSLQKRTRQTIHFFDQVSFVVYYAKNFPKITYTRLTEHYRPIINLCKLIIENSTLNFQKTGEIQYSSFLIDMNRLFESFLLGFLTKKLKGYNVRGEGRRMHDYSLDTKGEMTQKPDIIVRKNGLDLLVIDAKYKQLQTNQNRQFDVIISDARQVWSYCRVPKRKMPIGILVYPKHQLIEQAKASYSLKENVCIILKALDLSNASAEAFEKECNSFAEEIVNLLNETVIPVMTSAQTVS